MIFKMGSKRIDSLKYLRSTMLDCKDTEIWKSELGAKAQFLCVAKINFLKVNYKIQTLYSTGDCNNPPLRMRPLLKNLHSSLRPRLSTISNASCEGVRNILGKNCQGV